MMFVFVATHVERGPSVGPQPTTTDPLWEVRSIPGNLVGVGNSVREASKQLVQLIAWTRAREGSLDDWYREAWSYADPGDERFFDRHVSHQVRTLRQPRKIDEQVGYELATA